MWHGSIYSLECVVDHSFMHGWQKKKKCIKGAIFRNNKTKRPKIQHVPLGFHILTLSMANANSVTHTATLLMWYLQSSKERKGWSSCSLTHLQMGFQIANNFTILLLLLNLLQSHNNYILAIIYCSRIELLVFLVPTKFTFYFVHLIKSQCTLPRHTHKIGNK